MTRECGAASARAVSPGAGSAGGRAATPEDPFGSYLVLGGSAASPCAAAEPVHAVGHVGRGQHGHAVAELVGHRLVLIEPAALQRGRPVAAQALLGQRGDLVGQGLRRRPRLARRDHPVGQAHRQRLRGGDRPPGQDHVQRPAQPDHAGQPHRAAVDQRHAPAAAEHAQHRVLLGHPQVAPQRQLQAAGHGVPGDRGDHRLGQPQPGRPHRPVAVRRGPVAVRAADRLEVGPGAERPARAPQHGHVGAVIGVERAEGPGQGGRGRPVHRVAHVRAVQDDCGDRPVPLHPHGHGALLGVTDGSPHDKPHNDGPGAGRALAGEERMWVWCPSGDSLVTTLSWMMAITAIAPHPAGWGTVVSDAPERLGWGQACGADGWEEPGQGADEQGGGQAAGPGLGRDDDGLAVDTGVGGGGGDTGDDTGDAAGQGQQDRLGQELGADLAAGGAQRPAQPDLGAAFQHRDDHDVGHPDRADQQRDRAQSEEQGVERALRVGPGGECL